MSNSISALTGWAKHQHFGLREEWVDLYLGSPENWRGSGLLGPDQEVSLGEWLVTTGLRDRSGPTHLGQIAVANGELSSSLWQILWVNVVFNLASAYWYVLFYLDRRNSTTQLAQELREMVPRLAVRTTRNAIAGLVGLLQRTPIGTELGQGIVTDTRPRTVERVGLAYPDSRALVHAMRRLFQREGQGRLSLDQDLVWPWVVFGCNRDDALVRLSGSENEWLTVEADSVGLNVSWEELDELALY